jgi:hypothetical protein
MLSVINVECHLCLMLFMLSVVMPNVIKLKCHLC